MNYTDIVPVIWIGLTSKEVKVNDDLLAHLFFQLRQGLQDLAQAREHGQSSVERTCGNKRPQVPRKSNNLRLPQYIRENGHEESKSIQVHYMQRM